MTTLECLETPLSLNRVFDQYGITLLGRRGQRAGILSTKLRYSGIPIVQIHLLALRKILY
jgi:hypothetical protein